jgi:hypothetical protein
VPDLPQAFERIYFQHRCRTRTEDSNEKHRQSSGSLSTGLLRVVERSVPEPGVGQVRIRVEAWGICHTDAATVQQGNQKIQVDLA